MYLWVRSWCLWCLLLLLEGLLPFSLFFSCSGTAVFIQLEPYYTALFYGLWRCSARNTFMQLEHRLDVNLKLGCLRTEKASSYKSCLTRLPIFSSVRNSIIWVSALRVSAAPTKEEGSHLWKVGSYLLCFSRNTMNFWLTWHCITKRAFGYPSLEIMCRLPVTSFLYHFTSVEWNLSPPSLFFCQNAFARKGLTQRFMRFCAYKLISNHVF